MSAKRSSTFWRWGEHLRHEGAQGDDFFSDGGQPFVEKFRQVRAFAAAAVLQFGECLVEQRQGFVVQGLRIVGIGHQNTGPGQHFKRVERRGLLDQAGNRFRGGDQLAGPLAINLQGLACGFFDKAQGAFDLAARQALTQRLANPAFQIPE